MYLPPGGQLLRQLRARYELPSSLAGGRGLAEGLGVAGRGVGATVGVGVTAGGGVGWDTLLARTLGYKLGER